MLGQNPPFPKHRSAGGHEVSRERSLQARTATISTKSLATGSLSLRVLASTLRVLRFPLAAIERRNGHFLDRSGVNAPCVDADAVRMRARHIERFDAAYGTEQML